MVELNRNHGPVASQPLLSIVTIVRNDQENIERTILSVLSQKTAEIEYVVIDGASSDHTMAIVNRHAGAIDQIVSEPDGGIYDALNKGICKATGAWIGLVHSGDIYLPGALGQVIDELNSHPEADVIYGAIKTFSDGHFRSIWGWSHEFLAEKMIPHMGAFVRATTYEKHGLYDQKYKIAADYDAFLRFYRAGASFQFIDLIVGGFDLSGRSQANGVLTSEETNAIRVAHQVAVVEPRLKRWLRGVKKRLLRT